MKKFISILLALMLVMSLGTVAFAAEGYSDMSSVTLTKTYNLENPGTISPEETFSFSELTCTSVTDAASGVTTANAPVPTIDSVKFEEGDAGKAGAMSKTVTITLPDTYTSVGKYTYTFNEVSGTTAGVDYRQTAITLVVDVLNGENGGFIRQAHVRAETGNQEKTDTFGENKYSAGSLTVEKHVDGLMGDKTREFDITVTFTAPVDTVKSTISYGASNSIAPAAWVNNGDGTASAEAVINLADKGSVTFTNIPYGVTYKVVEDDYTGEGYKPAAYDKQEGTIEGASVTSTITNTKEGTVDTGISLDSLPYILMLVVVGAAIVVVSTRKKGEQF